MLGMFLQVYTKKLISHEFYKLTIKNKTLIKL
jgi:hypothetical protein